MPRHFRLGLAAGLALLASWQSGCFTEVGNAEDERLVAAKFQIDYGAEAVPLPKLSTQKPETVTANILQFRLSVREAEFHFLDSASGRTEEFHLWKDDAAALPVDFSGKDTTAVLPMQKVGSLSPKEFHLLCVVPKRDTLKVDTVDFNRFADWGYIKGEYQIGKESTAFLFALPKSRGLELDYSSAALHQWYQNGVYQCRFIFFANAWIAEVDLSGAAAIKDMRGKPLVILDPEHNAVLYKALSVSFYKSFNTLKVSASSDP